jgi:hypothetical protein
MLRLASLVIALAACSSAAPTGPAWPKPTAHDSDGGEALAPRAAAKAISAIAEEDKPADRAAADKPAAAAPASSPTDKPAAATPATVTPAEDPTTTEDIVIEIDD